MFVAAMLTVTLAMPAHHHHGRRAASASAMSVPSRRRRKIADTAMSKVSGYTAGASIDTMSTPEDMARQAVADADNWWASQGTHPPPLELTLGPNPDGEHMGFGYYNSGRVNIDPAYLQNFHRALTTSATRRGKVEALVGLWRLMAHERGHNAGFQHIPGGIMDATWSAPPGEAYTWANRILGPAKPPARQAHVK